jgi:protein phosphatase
VQLKIEAVCDVGIKRKVNQDMVLVGNEYFREMDNDYGIEIEPNARPFFIAVSDGMGGHQAGEIASELVLNKSSEFVQLLKNGLSEAQLTKAITEFYTKLHKEFMDEGEKDIGKKGMGATLVTPFLLRKSIPYKYWRQPMLSISGTEFLNTVKRPLTGGSFRDSKETIPYSFKTP